MRGPRARGREVSQEENETIEEKDEATAPLAL